MIKFFLNAGCLIRKEHFGTLILLPEGKRFCVDNKFFAVLKNIHNKTLNEIEKTSEIEKEEIKEFVSDCQKKGIISKNVTKNSSKQKPQIIENKYISKDCLSFPRTVYLECTRKCNYNCIHCYSSSGERNQTEMPFEMMKKVIDEMNVYGAEFLNIGGGEPLLYNNLYATISYANKKNIPIEITTNGYFADDTTISKLKKAGLKYIQVSLDGSTQKVYSTIRPGGDIKRIKENIKRLVKHKFVVSVCTVVNKVNYNEIFDIIKLCKDSGVQYYRILPCIQVGRGAQIDNLQVDKVQIQNLYKKIMKLSEKDLKGLKISFNENLVIPNRKNIDRMPENHYGCSAGRSTCGIDVYGNVYPCSYMLFDTLLCGNIQKKSLMGIWKSSKVMKDIREIEKITGKCSTCDFIKLCRGGCRAAAYAKYDSLDAEDPLCSIK